MTYFLDPFGCVKNQVDAENMMAHLNKEGWESASEANSADIIIVNSCGFIESAKQESIKAVLEWRKLYPNKKILLAGCLAQRYAKELAESLPEADGFFGVADISKIADAASKLGMRNEELGIEDCCSEAKSKEEKKERKESKELNTGERPLLSLPGSAYVKISEGCNNRCSFCAIPLIRGGLVSRATPDIVEECQTLLKRGIRELCIIGQDIGSFGKDVAPNVSKLPELLDAISSLKGDFWVRLLYIHPDNFPLQILDIMERDTRILPYFDIPFQHASPKILASMNRRGTAEQYLALLETIRRRFSPGASLTNSRAVIRSTFLLGFPGETEEDFAALLDFQEKAKLDWLGCFTYSREDGTAAFSMKERVSRKTAAERKQIIEERQVPITEKNMDRFAGQTAHVLIEEQIEGGASNDDENFWLGRLYCQAPDVDGAAVIVTDEISGKNLQAGNFAPCRVIARRGFDLEVSLRSSFY